MNLVDKVNSLHMNENRQNLPNFKSGDTIAVSVRITEGAKSRIQLFQGIVIAMKNPKTINGHFRVRKISNGLGVERVFPFHSPNVTDVKVLSRGKTRRAKHFYLRERSGKSARIKVDYDRKD
jgi:large subunit ribosomal protein L19